jgi:hypothetical protein
MPRESDRSVYRDGGKRSLDKRRPSRDIQHAPLPGRNPSRDLVNEKLLLEAFELVDGQRDS